MLLKDTRTDPTVNDGICLRSAADNGRADVVLVLLKDGRVDPSVANNYAITNASANGRTFGHSQLINRSSRRSEISST